MAEANDENSLNNNEESDTENQHEEYLPNVVRVEPDIGLGDHSQQLDDRKRRNIDINQTRREDGPISFRHFLQNESGMPTSASTSTACPDLYRCSRQERPNPEGSAIDPESPVLPDFVQDNLALEHMYFNSDLKSVDPKILPDFTPYDSYNSAGSEPSRENHGQSSHRSSDSGQASGTSRFRIPLDLPVPSFLLDNDMRSLPFDLTTQTGNLVTAGDVRSPTETELAGTGGRLPDFLSDGHVLGHGNPRHRDARIVTSENGTDANVSNERHGLIVSLRQDNDRLRDEISVLQSILMKKDDRIKELEDLVMALEISKLQMSSDANTQTNKSSSDDEVAILRKELEASKKMILNLHKQKIKACSDHYQSSLSQGGDKELKQSQAEVVFKVKQMTDTSERLVKQLMKVIGDMKSDFGIEGLTETFDDTEKPGPSSDFGASPSIK